MERKNSSQICLLLSYCQYKYNTVVHSVLFISVPFYELLTKELPSYNEEKKKKKEVLLEIPRLRSLL